jgi:signal transduction histidine kinase
LQSTADGSGSHLDYQLLDETDGLPSAECSPGQPNCAVDSTGKLWFATQKGVTFVDPAHFHLNTRPPPIDWVELTYHRSVTDSARRLPRLTGTPHDVEVRLTAPFVQPLRFPPGTHGLEIEYTALSFSAPEKIRFQYKLESKDSDWEDVQNRRIARFHQMQPGDYVFHVRAANEDGIWNENGVSLAFTVLPYTWQTWWFRAGAAMLLVGIGAAAAWQSSRKHVQRALEQERTANEIRDLAGRLINAQEDERRRIARELHDDFSQRLALLSVEMDLAAAGKGGNGQAAEPRLNEIAARVNELSVDVHRMAYELHPAKLDQLGLATAARSFCREAALQSGLRIDFEAGDVPRDLPPDLALCFYRILQESLQNVVRHSETKEARVRLKTIHDRIQLTVEDAGRGFDVAQRRREGGLGLSSMEERVRLVKGTLTVRSAPGQGTWIEVNARLPARKSTDETGGQDIYV